MKNIKENLGLKSFIDSDSHVEENDAFFDYLDKKYEHRRPYIVDVGDMVRHRPERNKLWLIDGEIRPKLYGRGPSCYGTPSNSKFASLKPVPPSVQSISDVGEYLECMDTIGLDETIIFSTLFLHPVTEDPFFEAALMSSWNTYVAMKCGDGGGRLKFAALVPMSDPVLAKDEVTRAKELGASAIMILPYHGNSLLHDRKYDCVYDAIVTNNLSLCVHVGWAHKGIASTTDSIAANLVLNFEMSMMFGLFSFLAGGILDRFPDLRVAFIEAGTVWLPAIIDRIEGWRKTPTAEIWPTQKGSLEYLKENSLYFTVAGNEVNLMDFIDLVGEDRILGSSDFPHVHYEGGKLGSTLFDLANHSSLTSAQKIKFLGENAKNFYNI